MRYRMDQNKQQDMFGNQRIPGCSYYEAPQQIYTNLGEPAMYKDSYMPEPVETFNQMNYGYDTNLEDEIKSEPMDYMNQNHQHSEHISHHNYIDHDHLEKIKIERKRERNRIAASKCRQRKIERIQQLEEQVKELKEQKQSYEESAEKLRHEVQYLRKQLKDHLEHGCNMEKHPFPGPDSTCTT